MSQPNSFDDEPMMFDEAGNDPSMEAEMMEPAKQYRISLSKPYYV